MAKSRDFSDQSYIDDYIAFKKFPEIHKNIIAMVKTYCNRFETCVDLGSNTGLLSLAMIKECGRSAVLGIEADKKAYERAMENFEGSYIEFMNTYINHSTLPLVRSWFEQFTPTLVIARRVFPEIGENDTTVVSALAKMFHETGVVQIVLEGRVPTPNHKFKLWNAELEIQQLSNYYKPIKQYKAVYLLERL